jgi:hypothetical protein
MNVEWKNWSQDPIEKRFEDLLEVSTCPLAYEIYNIHPLALQMRMRQSDGDTPTFKDVLKMDADERSKWYDAWMLNSALSSNGTASALFPFPKLETNRLFHAYGLFARNVIPMAV